MPADLRAIRISSIIKGRVLYRNTKYQAKVSIAKHIHYTRALLEYTSGPVSLYNILIGYSVTMAAISTLQLREAGHQLSKRSNWASREAGVIVVFCVVFIVATGLISLWVSRLISRRRAARSVV
jgi:hypothetical protein